MKVKKGHYYKHTSGTHVAYVNKIQPDYYNKTIKVFATSPSWGSVPKEFDYDGFEKDFIKVK